MNIKYRKLIARIKPLHRIIKVVWYNSGYFSYKKIYKKKNYHELFNSMKNSCNKKSCFIIGNGPSLRTTDLDRLKNIDSFGMNEIHKVFSSTTWRPKYYLIMDRYSKTSPEQLRDVDCEYVFLGDYYCRFNKVLRDDAIRVHQHIGFNEDIFKISHDISSFVTSSPTVSFIAMQIAAYLGYKEIYLLGFDHNYSFEFASNGSIIRTNSERAHFFEDDIPEDIIANVRGMQRSYECFRDYAKENRMVVKNATRGGKLQVFERVDFDSLFVNNRFIGN